jgi:uncharacterized cupin superfamily protein
MVEARLEATEGGLAPATEGWFVVNVRDGRWMTNEVLGDAFIIEGDDAGFDQVGYTIGILQPGQAGGRYHHESDQEDFLVLAGEALLIVEGEERPLEQWDFVHCPPETKHVIVGAGSGPCVVLAVGARVLSTGPDWGGYPVDETALRHGAGVEDETTDPFKAYAPVQKREPTRYREGWLPE